MKPLLTLFFILFLTHSLFAGDFEEGFKEGYKMIRGDLVIVPITPIEPITPIGSNSYREGLKAGMKKGKTDEENN